MNLVCPACTRRSLGLVERTCVVCRGRGVVVLGPEAVREFGAAVVARAVLLGLEARARIVEAEVRGELEQRQRGVVDTLALLTDAGLLCGSNRLSPGMLRASGVRVIATEAVGAHVTSLDEVLIDARPHAYRSTDQPRRRGAPVLSRAGHPSYLARACDPADPFADTAEEVLLRDGEARRAVELHEAAPEAAQIVRARRSAADAAPPLFDLP